jgi:glutathione synthase/RimK-type ligase-like ATP-grasp enzyme
MPTLLVVDRTEDWPLDVSGVDVVPARIYLTDPHYSALRGAKLFNLCRSYRYQSLGYYVSLLATARGHRPLPSVTTIQDLKSRSPIWPSRSASNELDELVARSLRPLASDEFTLSVYFGRNVAQRYRRLALKLFNLFPAPMLRAVFARSPRSSRWEIRSLRPIAFKDVPEEHREFLRWSAREFFAGRRLAPARRPATRFDLAILINPEDPSPPSDDRALQKLVRAAHERSIGADLIGPDDFGRLGEYDALFLRETTRVDHHTYRFARRAAAEGLVVIDDPDSIVRCTNKVYLAERLARARIPTPKTVVVHRDNAAEAAAELGFPCVLKMPDSSFSQGVFRADDEDAFTDTVQRLLATSDLVIGQEFFPSEFDWRVGVLDREALYVCRYHMAAGHWQIVHRDPKGRRRYGPVDAVPIGEVPRAVLSVAVRAANLMGDGLYGVDVKERRGRAYVIEVNDNPTLESGYEDGVLGDALYGRIMDSFLRRLERARAAPAPSAPGRGGGAAGSVPEGTTP